MCVGLPLVNWYAHTHSETMCIQHFEFGQTSTSDTLLEIIVLHALDSHSWTKTMSLANQMSAKIPNAVPRQVPKLQLKDNTTYYTVSV